jgi:NADPH:quinone reductase-like Zn-dependent oxidoreductase
MKAVFIERYGGPEVLKYADLPGPAAAPGEVIIDVIAASVNAADWKARAGQYAPSKFPLVETFPGWLAPSAAVSKTSK